MPGFVDIHHHHFETTLRSHLPDGSFTGDGLPAGTAKYMGNVMGKFPPVYEPRDVQAGKLRSWRTRLLDVDLYGPTSRLDASRDRPFAAAQVQSTCSTIDGPVRR